MQSELSKQAEHLLALFENQNNETQEYAQLLADIANYDYCMSQEFSEALSKEISMMIDLEYEWQREEY